MCGYFQSKERESMRRFVLKGMMAFVAACAMTAMAAEPAATTATAPAASTAAAKEAPIKVVYDVSEGLEQASRALANVHNELRAEPNSKIIVVTHGEGIKFLLDGAVDGRGRQFEAIVSALASQGVEFRVCNNTLNAYGIAANKVILEAKVVPSGVAEVARLQAREGYAYIHP
jgi:intracellular sulfur oxidation DsrE/DsrF family protein